MTIPDAVVRVPLLVAAVSALEGMNVGCSDAAVYVDGREAMLQWLLAIQRNACPARKVDCTGLNMSDLWTLVVASGGSPDPQAIIHAVCCHIRVISDGTASASQIQASTEAFAAFKKRGEELSAPLWATETYSTEHDLFTHLSHFMQNIVGFQTVYMCVDTPLVESLPLAEGSKGQVLHASLDHYPVFETCVKNPVASTRVPIATIMVQAPLKDLSKPLIFLPVFRADHFTWTFTLSHLMSCMWGFDDYDLKSPPDVRMHLLRLVRTLQDTEAVIQTLSNTHICDVNAVIDMMLIACDDIPPRKLAVPSMAYRLLRGKGIKWIIPQVSSAQKKAFVRAASQLDKLCSPNPSSQGDNLAPSTPSIAPSTFIQAPGAEDGLPDIMPRIVLSSGSGMACDAIVKWAPSRKRACMDLILTKPINRQSVIINDVA